VAPSVQGEGVYRPITSLLTALSRLLALIGGALLLVVTILVVVSVGGRALIWAGLGPVPGDFELVEAATALAVFCFLPWCQMERGHVSVDVFADMLGPRVDAVLQIAFNILMTAAAAFILWRLWAGMQDKMQYNETTFILQFPVWWGYAACVPVAAVFVLVCAWTVVRSATETRAAFSRPGMERR
jgi:TRAP-type C4-dicarboxylate transport system permease small subunit